MELHSFKDSKQFFTMARGSVAEVESHLYVMLDRKMISKVIFDDLYVQATKTSKLINGLIKNVNFQIAK